MGKQNHLSKRKLQLPVFPCTQNLPLLTKPYSGLLVPPQHLESILKESKDLSKLVEGPHEINYNAEKKTERYWECWLCSKTNRKEEKKCSSCTRPRRAKWLQFPSGDYAEVGSLVEIRTSRDNVQIGLVTQIDYRKQKLIIYGTKLSKENPSNAGSEGQDGNENIGTIVVDEDPTVKAQVELPKQIIITRLELEQGKCNLLRVQEELKSNTGRVMFMCDFLLCGRCGSVSRLSNGRAALRSEVEKNDMRGRLRLLTDDIAEKEKEVKYMNRKWKETKQGWDSLKEATEELSQLQRRRLSIENMLLPPQFWCPFCGSDVSATNSSEI